MPSPKTKLKVLFLCTGNSCRSQMAEGWARNLKERDIEPYSAGIEAHGQNPRAIQVMKEAGVDISSQTSKRVDELSDVEFDYVITVCDHAHEQCPVFPGRAKVVHVDFQDPAKAQGTDEKILESFRKVRDEVRGFVETLPGALQLEVRAGQSQNSQRIPEKGMEKDMNR